MNLPAAGHDDSEVPCQAETPSSTKPAPATSPDAEDEELEEISCHDAQGRQSSIFAMDTLTYTANLFGIEVPFPTWPETMEDIQPESLQMADYPISPLPQFDYPSTLLSAELGQAPAAPFSGLPYSTGNGWPEQTSAYIEPQLLQTSMDIDSGHSWAPVDTADQQMGPVPLPATPALLHVPVPAETDVATALPFPLHATLHPDQAAPAATNPSSASLGLAGTHNGQPENPNGTAGFETVEPNGSLPDTYWTLPGTAAPLSAPWPMATSHQVQAAGVPTAGPFFAGTTFPLLNASPWMAHPFAMPPPLAPRPVNSLWPSAMPPSFGSVQAQHFPYPLSAGSAVQETTLALSSAEASGTASFSSHSAAVTRALLFNRPAGPPQPRNASAFPVAFDFGGTSHASGRAAPPSYTEAVVSYGHVSTASTQTQHQNVPQRTFAQPSAGPVLAPAPQQNVLAGAFLPVPPPSLPLPPQVIIDLSQDGPSGPGQTDGSDESTTEPLPGTGRRARAHAEERLRQRKTAVATPPQSTASRKGKEPAAEAPETPPPQPASDLEDPGAEAEAETDEASEKLVPKMPILVSTPEGHIPFSFWIAPAPKDSADEPIPNLAVDPSSRPIAKPKSKKAMADTRASQESQNASQETDQPVPPAVAPAVQNRPLSQQTFVPLPHYIGFAGGAQYTASEPLPVPSTAGPAFPPPVGTAGRGSGSRITHTPAPHQASQAARAAAVTARQTRAAARARSRQQAASAVNIAPAPPLGVQQQPVRDSGTQPVAEPHITQSDQMGYQDQPQ